MCRARPSPARSWRGQYCTCRRSVLYPQRARKTNKQTAHRLCGLFVCAFAPTHLSPAALRPARRWVEAWPMLPTQVPKIGRGRRGSGAAVARPVLQDRRGRAEGRCRGRAMVTACRLCHMRPPRCRACVCGGSIRQRMFARGPFTQVPPCGGAEPHGSGIQPRVLPGAWRGYRKIPAGGAEVVTESAAPLRARAAATRTRCAPRARACRYTLAAESGLVSAQFNLGSMYKKARTSRAIFSRTESRAIAIAMRRAKGLRRVTPRQR